ncbi:MAG: DUF58 domain-containing protein [Gemmatales bacterium]|nr:DUF58 domain-containing protein [Gemmatales bacterium]MDW8175781.1 DUF58 domain-containing protein [Gemmatales bacterium]
MNESSFPLPGVVPGTLATWLRRLQLLAKRAVEGGAGGRFASLFRGAGISFEELREYQPGDDIRAIEWKATARLGTPFVKRFIEERELSVVIALDKSGSMAYGSQTRSKWHTAVETAALLALLAAHNRDRVGLALFDSDLRPFLPPRRGLQQAWREVAVMLLQRPQHEPTSLAQACRALAKLLRRRTLIFVISDFLDRDYVHDLQRLAQRHDLIVVRVWDDAEACLPERGYFLLQDAETGQRLWCDAYDSHLREIWSATGGHFAEMLAAMARAADADLWDISTSEDILSRLQYWLRQRQLRVQRRAAIPQATSLVH